MAKVLVFVQHKNYYIQYEENIDETFDSRLRNKKITLIWSLYVTGEGMRDKL